MERLTSRNPLTGSEALNLSLTDLYMRLKSYEDAEEEGRLVSLPPKSQDLDFMRIFELITADGEERAIILPCKVGDAVYYINGYGIYKAKATTFRFNESGIRVYCERKFMGVIGFEGIYGKTVFLTREEAEAALKGERNETTDL